MVKFNEHNELELEVLEVSDVINLSQLQRFQDSFAIGMRCASVTVDKDGQPITEPSSYTHFCEKCVHTSLEGDRRCAISHNEMGEKAARTGRPYAGECHAGLIDFAAPIMIEGKLIGTVLGGQILKRALPEAKVRRVAQEIDADANEMIDAAKKVDLVSEKQLNAMTNVLYLYINTLAQNGYNHIRIEHAVSEFSENIAQITSVLKELRVSSDEVNEQQNELNKQILQVGEYTKRINSILSDITKIADQTMILGLNASIEAGRAGEVGKGFSVVAAEIRSLSDNSKETATKIEDLTEKISRNIGATVQSSQTTMDTTQKQYRAVATLSDMVSRIAKMTDVLGQLILDSQRTRL